MTRATVTKDGRILLPERIRQSLDLRHGDTFEVELTGDGSVRLKPAALPTSAADYLSLCHSVYEGLSDDDLSEIEAIVLDRSTFRTGETDG